MQTCENSVLLFADLKIDQFPDHQAMSLGRSSSILAP